MDEQGLRRPGKGGLNGFLNNVQRGWGKDGPWGNGYMGCTEQCGYLTDRLRDPSMKNELSLDWRITERSGWSITGPHNWVEAVQDGTNTRVRFDSWYNLFQVESSDL